MEKKHKIILGIIILILIIYFLYRKKYISSSSLSPKFKSIDQCLRKCLRTNIGMNLPNDCEDCIIKNIIDISKNNIYDVSNNFEDYNLLNNLAKKCNCNIPNIKPITPPTPPGRLNKTYGIISDCYINNIITKYPEIASTKDNGRCVAMCALWSITDPDDPRISPQIQDLTKISNTIDNKSFMKSAFNSCLTDCK